MKRLIELYGRLSTEVESWCCARALLHSQVPGLETGKDLAYMKKRIDHEGLEFLTITLPTFGKALEQALAAGRVSDDMFPGFRKHAALPKYLGWLLRLVFDPITGILLPVPNVDAIDAIRQLTLAFAKIEIDCSKERIDAAYERYLEVDRDVEVARIALEESAGDLSSDFRRASRVLLDKVLWLVERDLNTFELVPKHGPGNTADRLTGNGKYNLTEWTERLDVWFPKELYAIPSPRYFSYLQGFDMREPGAERPARVTHVPKTLKTPRLIAMEPTCMMYVQQALAESFWTHLQSSRKGIREVVKGVVGRHDQDVNRLLAMKGSRDGSLATIDLSDASDRVSTWHVEALLSDHPDLLGAVMAARSTHAEVPSNNTTVIRPLAKYASMGSALTFPLESMVFMVIAYIGVAKSRGVPLTTEFVTQIHGQVRVYGDDIIVPVDSAREVMQSLEAYGFKVNYSKSFWTGKFRESCGGDYYDGHDISIEKVRSMISFSPQNVGDFVSTVELRNRLYYRGYWQTVKWMDEMFAKARVSLPTIHGTSSALSRHTLLDYEVHRVDVDLHSPLVKAFVVRAKIERNPLDGVGALLKSHLKRGVEPMQEGHLERSGRAVSVSIKKRLVRPF